MNFPFYIDDGKTKVSRFFRTLGIFFITPFVNHGWILYLGMNPPIKKCNSGFVNWKEYFETIMHGKIEVFYIFILMPFGIIKQICKLSR